MLEVHSYLLDAACLRILYSCCVSGFQNRRENDSLPVPLFHEPVTKFLLVPVDCVSGGDEGVGMNGRVM